MKCAKCGAELKEGCLYCSVCGHEAQMVNGYSVLEEDYLKALLTDEASKDTSSEETENQNKKAEGHHKKKKQTPWIVLRLRCCSGCRHCNRSNCLRALSE